MRGSEVGGVRGSEGWSKGWSEGEREGAALKKEHPGSERERDGVRRRGEE